MSEMGRAWHQAAQVRRAAVGCMVVGAGIVLAGVLLVAFAATTWGASAISLGLVLLVAAFALRTRAYRLEFAPPDPETRRQGRKGTLLGIGVGVLFVVVVMGRDIADLFR